MARNLAVNGGEPIRKKGFVQWPIHNEREVELIEEVINSGNWSFGGPKETEFAEKFAGFHGARYGECVINGTGALELALRSLDIMPGDEVLVPAITWVATATAPIIVGAVPVFVDIDPETYCIDPEHARKLVTERTKAMIPVHLYCNVCDMDSLTQLSSKYGVSIVEDCAHVVGTMWKGKGIGTIGKSGCFSFQQTKSMTSGDGGIIITDDEAITEKVYSLKNCGRTRGHNHELLGQNYRITEFQAAVLLAQLERLEGQIAIRESNIDYLTVKLRDLKGVKPLKKNPGTERQGVYSFVLRYDNSEFDGVPIEKFKKALDAEGIQNFDVYPPIYQNELWHVDLGKFPYANNMRQPECPNADNVYREAILLGHHMFLGDKSDMDDVVDSIRKIKDYAKELHE